jgi:hypothetical protein
MSTCSVEGVVKREWEFERLWLLNPLFHFWGKSLCLFEGIGNLDEMGKVVVVSNFHDLFPGSELLSNEIGYNYGWKSCFHAKLPQTQGLHSYTETTRKTFLLVTVHVMVQMDDRTIYFLSCSS